MGRRRSILPDDTAYAILAAKKGISGEDRVFTRNGRAIKPFSLQHAFKLAARRATLDDSLRWHSLGRTHASWLVQAGVSP